MQLISIEYEEYRGKLDEWKTKSLNFGQVNLIVGKNASGKSRILNLVGGLGALLSGKRRGGLPSGRYKAVFEGHDKSKEKRIIVYELAFDKMQVVSEKFTVNEKLYLSRNKNGTGLIQAAQLKKMIKFQAPLNELAAVARRDSIQHPFFEDLYVWGSSLKHYQFGSDFGKTNVAIFAKRGDKAAGAQPELDQNQIVAVYKRYKDELGARLDKAIFADMKHMGYECQSIGFVPVPLVAAQNPPLMQLYVKEQDLKCHTTQINMSQGMFRALALTIQLNASLLKKTSDCVLIDDVGEGLDFDRSTRLIALLIKKAEKAKFQLIMSTNDRFVMNAIPLKYWSVLNRIGSTVKVHNERNSPSLFKEFQYLGLSNFDFFKSEPFKNKNSSAKKWKS
jgi:energy-coupling factor transporter ATP-binding protein EcfA2